MSQMLTEYRAHVAEREVLGVPPQPLTDVQTADLIELLKPSTRRRRVLDRLA